MNKISEEKIEELSKIFSLKLADMVERKKILIKEAAISANKFLILIKKNSPEEEIKSFIDKL